MEQGPFGDRVPGAVLEADLPVDAAVDPLAGLPSDPQPESVPVWPPDVLPVVLWPEDVLRQALTGVPGAWLARVVAEAVDVDGNLDPGALGLSPGDTTSTDPGVDAGAGVGAGPGAGFSGSGVLADLSDDTLADLVAACGRLQSWAAGIQARVVAERAARESHPLAHSSLVGQVTTELVVTGSEASEVVVRGESGTRHPSVITALVTGRIDVRKAHTLLRSASTLTVAERAEAIDRYLPQAPRRTWKWLQARMLAFAKTRHGAAETAKAAARSRSVHIDRAENDMGWISAYLPAPDAAAVWGVVDDMARQLRHVTGEDRTLSQLRADSLTGIVTGRLLPADRYTDNSETGAGTETGAEDSGQAITLDTGEEPTGAPGGTDEPVCTCGGRAPVVVQEVVRPVRITPTRPVVRVTIPATALLGLDNSPGELAGFGPIPAETARLIATDATWQRLLTDPDTGILTDYSTTTYQPGKTLRTAIETRDTTCTFLGCDTPGTRCDLDHITPFDHDRKNTNSGRGQTNAHNLHALCRKHHLLKTHAGWGIVRDPDTGMTTWTTPSGRSHTRPPTVLDTHIDLDQIDPDTSTDRTLHALTGRRLPRPYRTTQPGAIPTGQPTETSDPTGPDDRDKPSF